MAFVIMKDGFYPALGTPTDDSGSLVKTSFAKQIELMVEAGASGVLCLGSMGRMATIRNREYPEIAGECCKQVSGRVPVMVGVMDCSVSRVLDRIEALGKIAADGVVATAPFYSGLNAGEIISFFSILSKNSRYPVYIYDLPSVTKSPLTTAIMKTLMELPEICGIKTGNLNLILDLYRNNLLRDDFSVFYSGLDLFDVALRSGISRNLDGMFTCTPFNSKKMYETMGQGNFSQVSEHLNNILALRNLFLKGNILPAYTYAMELLGCNGNFHPDYDLPVSEELKEEIAECMKSIKEI